MPVPAARFVYYRADSALYLLSTAAYILTVVWQPADTLATKVSDAWVARAGTVQRSRAGRGRGAEPRADTRATCSSTTAEGEVGSLVTDYTCLVLTCSLTPQRGGEA